MKLQETLVSPPDILLIFLKRWDRSFARKSTVMGITDALNVGNSRYRLRSFACHEGSKDSGHYLAYARWGVSRWIFNDEVVRQAAGDADKNHAEKNIVLLLYEKQ